MKGPTFILYPRQELKNYFRVFPPHSPGVQSVGLLYDRLKPTTSARLSPLIISFQN